MQGNTCRIDQQVEAVPFLVSSPVLNLWKFCCLHTWSVGFHCLLKKRVFLIIFFSPQKMKEVVNNEVAEFMKFAQNAAKSCTQDYDSISEDALRYTEVIIDAVFNSAFKQWYWNCD